ncbi:hypothetical protein PPERSA_01983 [Pseudocohnilembus persalinus]|uniref:TLC domain-containing protein n=1 Tax=Pseudocohnilembus persalinus TaxID=266149 RepID=A0A0V0QF40_PSEPJ|nr:hypothetical protein PPERSA_01983 [Pseudocohnilembus persalinus]|eukprot:KRX00804.1 hypothetical protein PPERSA_01983 [Pseudocohnilembus persalinus]
MTVSENGSKNQTQKYPENGEKQLENQKNQQTPPQKRKREKDWRTKINFEKIYFFLNVIVIGLIPFFINNMIQFRHYCDEKNYNYLQLSFLAYSLIAGAAIWTCRHLLLEIFYHKLYPVIPNSSTHEDRDLKTRKVIKWSCDILYYTSATVYGFYYFKDMAWFPLDFKENYYNTGVMDDFPSVQQNELFPYIQFYIIVQFGHHVYALIELIFVRRHIEPKFQEWLLHHTLAFTLLFYSNFNNFLVPGVMVLLVHDISDITTALFKLYGIFRSDYLLYVNTANMMISWFYTRLYAFPLRVIMPFIDYYRQLYIESEQDLPKQLTYYSYIYMLGLVFLLQLLHIYWFLIMITMLKQHLKRHKKYKDKVVFQNDFDFKDKKE